MSPVIKADMYGINPPGLLYAQDSLVQGQRNTAIPMTYTDTGFSLANGVPVNNPNSVASAAFGGSYYLGEAHQDWYGGLEIPEQPNSFSRATHGTDHRFVTATQQSCSAAPGPRYALGAGLLSPGENQQARRGLNQLSQTNVQHPQQIVAADTQAFRPMGKAAQWGKFGDALFNNNNMTQLYERKHLTGVFVNTNDGKMYETYEDDIPPPDSDHSMDPDQLKRANPQLIAKQGGIDFNRPPPQRREVQQNMPGADGGSNRWGDALYADGRRNREREIAAASIWGNRDGNYSVEPIMDARPNGYVGFQNMVRTAPYVPPTQRGRTDNPWEAPSHLGDTGAAQTTAPLQQLRPYLKEVAVDYTTGAQSDTPSFAIRVYKVDLPDTMRALSEGQTYTGALYAVENNTTGQLQFTYETDLEETLRAAMETSVNHQGAHTQVSSGLPGDAGYALERDGDVMDPWRGTSDSYQFITPVKAGFAHENSPFDGFCPSKSARPEREMGSISMPALAPNHQAWKLPPVTCKKRSNQVDYQARADALRSRPTYMGEGSVS